MSDFKPGFNGLICNVGTLLLLPAAQSRSLSAENPTGAKGQGAMAIAGAASKTARGLAQGWKIASFLCRAG
jgi:hypothetical protein